MDGFIVIILYVIMLVWGILNIILFFKLWGMINDICDIKELLYKVYPQNNSSADYRINTSNRKVESKFNLNDIVVCPSYDGELKIFDYMGNGEYNCHDAKTGAKAGFFKEEDLTLKK